MDLRAADELLYGAAPAELRSHWRQRAGPEHVPGGDLVTPGGVTVSRVDRGDDAIDIDDHEAVCCGSLVHLVSLWVGGDIRPGHSPDGATSRSLPRGRSHTGSSE